MVLHDMTRVKMAISIIIVILHVGCNFMLTAMLMNMVMIMVLSTFSMVLSVLSDLFFYFLDSSCH